MRGTGLRASWAATALAAAVSFGPLTATSTSDGAPVRPAGVATASTVARTLPPADAVAPSTPTSPTSTTPRPDPHLLVRIERPLAAHARPRGDSRVIGTMVARSKYYGVPLTAWVEDVAGRGRWGLVELPYVWPRREGWIRLVGLRRTTTRISVRVDLSEHRVSVWRDGERLFTAPAATGATISPTPTGEYFVTDRVPFARGSYLGSFAFGISGVQPHLPPGWSGGDQLAIHGTDSPRSIGTSASAGCVRVREAALARLRPLLRLGTPVVIVR